MNYLAHLYLAGDNPQHQVGHLLGDFVKSREIDGYPAGIRAGIRMHQRVDAFSEAHPVFAASRRRFEAPYRRYAGIIVDLVYDHFLAKHWREHATTDLSQFTTAVYAVLRRHENEMPPRLRRILPHMIADDWLGSYQDLGNIGRALTGISRRLRRENPLASSMEAVKANYEGLEVDFGRFFPDLERYSRELARAEGAGNPESR